MNSALGAALSWLCNAHDAHGEEIKTKTKKVPQIENSEEGRHDAI
jgi:ribulose kinase